MVHVALPHGPIGFFIDERQVVGGKDTKIKQVYFSISVEIAHYAASSKEPMIAQNRQVGKIYLLIIVKIAILGRGGYGSQGTLVFGTPGRIRSEGIELCDDLGTGGGFILQPGLSIQNEVPVENAVAFIETAVERERGG